MFINKAFTREPARPKARGRIPRRALDNISRIAAWWALHYKNQLVTQSTHSRRRHPDFPTRYESMRLYASFYFFKLIISLIYRLWDLRWATQAAATMLASCTEAANINHHQHHHQVPHLLFLPLSHSRLKMLRRRLCISSHDPMIWSSSNRWYRKWWKLQWHPKQSLRQLLNASNGYRNNNAADCCSIY